MPSTQSTYSQSLGNSPVMTPVGAAGNEPSHVLPGQPALYEEPEEILLSPPRPGDIEGGKQSSATQQHTSASTASQQGTSQDSQTQQQQQQQQQHHKPHTFRDQLTQKLMQGMEEDALLKLIERAGILPTEQPMEETAREDGRTSHHGRDESGVTIKEYHRDSTADARGGQQSYSASASPSASPLLGPADASAPALSKRQRAMQKLSSLRTTAIRSDTDSTITQDSSSVDSPGSSSSISLTSRRRRGSGLWAGRPLAELQQLHRNLESRLRAFWTYRVEHRELRIEIEPIFSDKVHARWKAMGYETPPPPRLLATTAIWTNSSGRFEHRLTVPWYMLESFCKHHETTRDVHPIEIVALRVRAVLMDHKSAFQRAMEWATSGGSRVQSSTASPASAGRAADLSSSVGSNASSLGSNVDSDGAGLDHKYAGHMDEASTPWIQHAVGEDGSGRVRVISDIDDTCKHTDITGGLRSVFHNVFVKSFHEVTIDGVAKWYQAMVDAGAPIHYVSNAPLELYGLVRGYMGIAGLPPGHLHMKMYPTGARNLLASYLEPAGERKKGAVTAIMDNFKDSKFILVGDSGELDLELYSQIAADRPHQVSAIYIRDVSTPRPSRRESTALFSSSVPASTPVTPAGTNAMPGYFDAPSLKTAAQRAAAASGGTSSGNSSSAASIASTTSSQESANTQYSESEWRRREAFRLRVKKAKELVPASIPLRFYRTGDECEPSAVEIIRQAQEQELARSGKRRMSVPEI